MKTVNVDMDGVIYDFVGTFAKIAVEQRWMPAEAGDSPPTQWAMWKHWGISRYMFYQMFDVAILRHGLFQIGDPVPGAVDGLAYLLDRFERVRVVTSKQMKTPEAATAAQQQCLAWLARHVNPSAIEVAFTSNKRGYLADVVIDDKPTLQWTQKGALNVLFDQPWNQMSHYKTEDHGYVVRAGWKGLDRVIEIWEGMK